MTMTGALADPDQPFAVFRALEDQVRSSVGVRLFTLMQVDHDRGVAWRAYSNMPEAYPTSGEKPIPENIWTEQVLVRRETFVANSIDEIAAVFPDHALIQSLGCESCINIPVVIAGDVVGTMNCLDVAGHYTPEKLRAADALIVPGALAFLLSQAGSASG
ncbi:GAF domain-containing protein [Cognatishimia sp. F0-27]|uniref:GAF domain-containing protein n=1 Tax=Cognatishimia sp. F0-27 TaxID=2816855 RepID=UPI001D0C7BCE|nr:GAF domain-containing protein [Cognatishimia sp. F0-27]MCC1494648.1 GAF domain-containing protein [Cognatishimia sp. F0-27]